MRSAETVVGQVVDAFEDVEEAESGQDNWFSVIAYRFWLRDGREFVGKSQGPGRLPEHLRDATLPVSIDVEYLLADPSVNRLAGDGSQSMSHMLFRWSLGLFLFVMCARPGVAMLRDGLFAYRNASSRASDGAVENGSEVRASSS
jgi:hypothetical protein